MVVKEVKFDKNFLTYPPPPIFYCSSYTIVLQSLLLLGIIIITITRARISRFLSNRLVKRQVSENKISVRFTAPGVCKKIFILPKIDQYFLNNENEVK